MRELLNYNETASVAASMFWQRHVICSNLANLLFFKRAVYLKNYLNETLWKKVFEGVIV